MIKTSTRSERVRNKIRSRSDRLRLSVFVSNKHIYCQVIDDRSGKTEAAASDKEVSEIGKGVQVAEKVGELISKKAQEKGIKEVVLDRGTRRYHGRIKALAQGARKGGLNF